MDGLSVEGQGLQVALAALEALHVVDAVHHHEATGPGQVALAVHRPVLVRTDMDAVRLDIKHTRHRATCFNEM